MLEKREKTLYRLTKDTGLQHASLWNLAHGKAKFISFEAIEKICRALDCLPGDLIEVYDEGKVKGKGKK
jgi:putative transcriptional regulator